MFELWTTSQPLVKLQRGVVFADVHQKTVLSKATWEECSLKRTNISSSPFLRLIMMGLKKKKKILFFNFEWETKGFCDCHKCPCRSNPLLQRTLMPACIWCTSLSILHNNKDWVKTLCYCYCVKVAITCCMPSCSSVQAHRLLATIYRSFIWRGYVLSQ